jgi:hypothetical protein
MTLSQAKNSHGIKRFRVILKVHNIKNETMTKDGLVIIDFMRGLLDHPEARSTFMDIIRLRHDVYSEAQPTFLALDPMDLVGTHFVFYRNGSAVGASRCVDSARCQDFQLTLPIQSQIQSCGSPTQQVAWKTFFEETRYRTHNLGMLAVTPQSRTHSHTRPSLSENSENPINPTEALIWSCNYWGYSQGVESTCFTTNQKFKVSRWVKDLGLWPELGPIEHPLNRVPHDLILISQMRNEYFLERAKLYSELWNHAYVLNGASRTILPEPERSIQAV